MRLRRIGRSGLTVSVVGLGCNNFGGRVGREGTHAVVRAAVDAGVTLLDTADIYSAGTSEEWVGEALVGHRDDVVLATKFGKPMGGVNGLDWGARGSRRYIRTSVEASLRRLGTDRIDLLQMHEPDPATPIDESLAALDDLVHAGKVLYLGSSQFAAWQVVDAEWSARTHRTSRFVSTQEKYSVIDRAAERELIPACLEVGVGLLPFFPLEHGLLTGKYRRGDPAPVGSRLARETHRELLERAPWDRIEAVAAFAAERGRSMLDVGIGGLAAQPSVASVIAGATSPEQVMANVAAGAWLPTADDLAELDRITAPDLHSDPAIRRSAAYVDQVDDFVALGQARPLVAGRWSPQECRRCVDLLAQQRFCFADGAHLVRVVRPVGGQVQPSAGCKGGDREAKEVGLHQPPLVMPDLGPRVREVDADAREAARREHVAYEVDRVAGGHPYVRQVLGTDAREQAAEAGGVDVDRQQVGRGVSGRHSSGRLAGAEPDLEHDRPVVPEQVAEIEGSAVHVDAVGRPQPAIAAACRGVTRPRRG